MTENDIFKIITNNVCEVLPDLVNHSFKYEDQLVELGANSVDRAEIVSMTLDALSLKIPRVELFGVKNIGELAKVIYEKSK